MNLVISFITYNDSSTKYLSFLLESLKKSILVAVSNKIDVRPFFFVYDNSDKPESKNKEILEKFFSENNLSYKIWGDSNNIGFARAYNKMINESVNSGIDLFLVINPDVIVDKNFISIIINKSQEQKEISVFSPKILYWDFANNAKTDKIDSYGVSFNSGHRFFDRGQGLTVGEYSDQEQEIFGFSGAGALFRVLNLLDITIDNKGGREFFDEMMFMYKEDIDLSYRLQMAGKRVLFVPDAVMYHDRSLSSVNSRLFDKIFFKKHNNANNYSLLNQLIVLHKIGKLPFSSRIRLQTGFRKSCLFVFTFFFEGKILNKFKSLKGEIKQILAKEKGEKEEIERIESFISRY